MTGKEKVTQQYRRIASVTLQKIFEMLQIKYTYAVSQEWIDKPLAYALYHVWRYADAHEKKRKRDS